MRENRFFWILILVLICADLFVWVKIFSFGGGEEEIYFLDIGQGDGSLIVLDSGEKILVDGGKFSGPVLSQLEKVLGQGDRYIDLLIMSHADEDHFGGLVRVLERYEIGAFIGNGRISETETYKKLRELLRKKKIAYLRISEGDRIRILDSSLTFLSPSIEELLSDELNDSSLVFIFENPSFRVLYTGDAQIVTEHRILEDYDLNVDVLAVGHHGSKTSSAEDFLAEALPNFSIISVGENNYGHPNEEVLERLERYSKVFRTDENGLMKLRARNGKLELLGIN